jgi:FAD/FMN-containing dehydrogenase
LSAFEFFSELALRHVLKKGVHRPFDTETPYYVLVEFENPDESHTDEALALFEHCAEQGWLADGVISQSETQAKELWRLREDISESISEHQPYKNDIAVRISRVPALLAEIDELAGAGISRISRCCGMATSATAICTSTSSSRRAWIRRRSRNSAER